MITLLLAAGYGKRMLPLTQQTPKPLLTVAGKPLIVWQIERLAAAGFNDIIINHSWLGQQLVDTLGDGRQWQVRLRYSAEESPLESAGAIAQARPLLEESEHSLVLCVASDIYTPFDYAQLWPTINTLSRHSEPSMHLVMVPNPAFHSQGDFALTETHRLSCHGEKFTFSGIGLYDIRLFDDLPAGQTSSVRPYIDRAIANNQAYGELFTGKWHNVGTPSQLDALNRSLTRKLEA